MTKATGRSNGLWGLFLIILLITSLHSQGAYQPLQVISPRASGTGSPAIPSTHRIFSAYPGLAYKIRAQVVGGDYPYSFALNNAPAGMTVDSKGYIRWPNPQANAQNIGLRITDSSGNSINTSWSINVQTSGFRFVDINAPTNGNGSLTSPYNSIANMALTAAATDIIYFRSGRYPVPARGTHTIGNASAYQWRNPDTATKWIAYPGASVTIDLTNNRYFYEATNVPFYFDGLTFYQGREYFFRAISTSTYVTFLDNTFDTLTLERPNYNSNQETYFTMHGGKGYFLTFQGNKFSGFRGTQGIGSLYDQDTILVENNHFTDFSGANSTGQVLAFKTAIINLTLRGNVVILPASSDFGIMGSSLNSQFTGGTEHGTYSENIEVLYNYFRHDGSGLVEFNRFNNQRTTWVYRNTFASRLQMTYLDVDCNGPWIINNNVFQNASSGLSYHYSCSGNYTACVSQSGNVGATSGLINLEGKLLPGHITNLGLAGWQFPDGSTPMENGYSTPPGSSQLLKAPGNFKSSP